jgi:hypothetical protein
MTQNPGQRMMRVVRRVVKSRSVQNLETWIESSEPAQFCGDICAGVR